MSNSKISALASASTPLTGSEIVPINQSGVTDSVSVSNLTAGRAVSAASLSLTTTPLSGANGGTGLTSFTSNGVLYASSTSALATGSALTFDGTNLGLSGTGARYINLGSTSTNGQTVAYQISAPNSDASASVYRIGSGLTADNEWTVYDVTNSQTVDKYIRGSSGYRAFWTNGSERFRIDTSGNLIPKAAGTGINFTANTPLAGKTSQLLSYYEEGTYTPAFTSLTVTGTPTYTGNYTRIGRMMFVQVVISVSGGSCSSTADTTYFSLPTTGTGTSTLTAAQTTTTGSLGVGVVGTTAGYPPTWASQTSVVITFFYRI